MSKRIFAATMWLLSGWYLGAFIAFVMGLSWLLGPILGVAAAGLIAGDPLGVIWGTRRSTVTTPAAHAQGRQVHNPA